MDADLLPPEATMDAPRRSMQRLVLQSWQPGPLVARLDADFGDMAKNYQPHEKYREMRSLAIRLEHRLIALENVKVSAPARKESL